MLLVFFIFAALWVLAWTVLLVLGCVDMLFKSGEDGAYDNEPGFSVDD